MLVKAAREAGVDARFEADHQFIQPLYVSVMARAGSVGVAHDNEGSGLRFRTVRYVDPRQTELPTTCQMQRPEGL